MSIRNLLAAACALAIAGTASAQSVLRVRPFADIKAIDPIVNTDYATRNHGYLIYDTLFAVDAELTYQPQMVDTWTASADRLDWRFHLRPGLAFHDGAKVTATDVIASLQRWAKRDGSGQILMSKTAALEAVDADTIRLVLREPFGMVLDTIGKPSSQPPFIMPARIAQTSADQMITDPIGSGPFIMKKDEWLAGAKTVYVRNPAYIPRAEPASGLAGGKRAGFDRIEMIILPELQTALNALRTGQIDILEEITPDLVPLARRDGAITVARQDNLGQEQMLRMNWLTKPFDNAKLRAAVLYAIDQDEFVRAFSDDPTAGRACPSFYICASPYFTDAGWPKRPDLAKAGQMVRDSGYDGTPAVLLDPTDVQRIHAHILVADAMLRQIGINTRLDAMDFAQMIARRGSKAPLDKGGWSIFISGPAGLDMLEPFGHQALRAGCDKAWFGWPCDPQIEAMRAEFSNAPDLAARRRIAEAIQLRAIDSAIYWPVANLYPLRAYRATLTGILTPPVPVYWNIARR